MNIYIFGMISRYTTLYKETRIVEHPILDLIKRKHISTDLYHSFEHLKNVGEIACLIGHHEELSEHECELLRLAGYFHDFIYMGYKDDLYNVLNSVREFSRVFDTKDPDDNARIAQMMLYTIFNGSAHLISNYGDIAYGCMRDADQLASVIYFNKDILHSQYNTFNPNVSLDTFMTQQKEYYNNLKLYTKTGNALLQEHLPKVYDEYNRILSEGQA